MSKALVCLALVVTSVAGCSGNSTGSMVDIGGRSLYLDCRGQGSPTVILEAGLTSDTTAWDDVIDPIAGFTRVCAYDRANNGRSDEVGLHSGDQSVSDLEKLLAAKKIEPPYVLVAWSFGGPISRLYAARHPDDVTGMVLVDTDPEDYRSEGDPYVPENVREHSYWASGNIGEGGSQGLPGPRVAELDELYLRLERRMTNLSSDSRLELIEDTGHCIQCDKPQIVIDAVREVVQSA